MSPRAAWRLETLGFKAVYDYVPGKVDWLAHGLPTEGERAGVRRVGDVARSDVVTCSLASHVGDVRALIESSPYGFALVTSEQRIVLGRLRRSKLDGEADDRPVEDVMEPGPST